MSLDDRTVQGLYEAAAGLQPWGAALDRLHSTLSPAGATQLIVLDRAQQRLALAETAQGSQMDAVLEHVREYHRVDPHVAAVLAKPVGDVMNTQVEFPIEQYRDHPFYREFWTPFGVQRLLGTKVYEDARYTAMAGVARVVGQPPFTAEDVALWLRYASHLHTALKIASHWQRAQATAIACQGLLEASRRPIFVLGAQRTLITANRAAHDAMAGDDTIFVRDGRLHCRGAANEAALAAAIASVAGATSRREANPQSAGSTGGAPESGAGRRRAGLRLAARGGATLLCSVWDARPAATLAAFGEHDAVLLTVLRHAHAGRAPASGGGGSGSGGAGGNASGGGEDELWLAALFELTPAEARVARQLLQGLTIDEIAAQSDRSAATVRTQVNALLAKTQTRRQSELVQLLMSATAL
jgi:DNA-binding CsgD family transcriptional regulator